MCPFHLMSIRRTGLLAKGRHGSRRAAGSGDDSGGKGGSLPYPSIELRLDIAPTLLGRRSSQEI